MRIAATPSGETLFSTSTWKIIPALLCLASFLLACGQRPPLIRQYVIEYSPPVTPALPRIDETLEIEEFDVAQAFNTTAMVYRPSPLESATYHYSSWRVNPGYMVTDYLARDFRQAGLFKAVFSRGSTGRGRFVLDGGVEEIQELNEPDGWKAALGLTVTLLDTDRVETPEMVIFQRKYRTVRPMLAKTPQGLAEAMSGAMQQLSQEIIRDVYQAAKARTAAGKK
ncbi:MAG: ABC-type transport auxiliary lipoprotein family protein [Deltaproteobacteria bacterium]|nr:ABC-type transport auxiliary lipoprotein family protein [Deltaproteobacteria bacterium]